MRKEQKMVAVVGSRTLAQCPELLARLDELHGAGELAGVVSGGAAGVDELAARWAMRNLVPLTEYRPDYAAHGRAAPLVRNGRIVAAADLVLVCWDGVSRGTLDAARRAARLGKVLEWVAAPAPGGGLGL
ncbi:SLOG family protein [Hymenobacter yonginensis]|uniref:SLOG family protein n=1 Tax=Hymenobacter yonginensis TaxID=748197 RepID=A0ABY7PP04_9BACT|nr:SLOG family protein [Hymenobacter yonginensis]WBO84491.1 SLOG family protein [Hymenobacter yonginensis]